MPNDTPKPGATDNATEIAGQATVDSPPAELDSADAENGLDATDENGVHLPGPVVDLDAAPEV